MTAVQGSGERADVMRQRAEDYLKLDRLQPRPAVGAPGYSLRVMGVSLADSVLALLVSLARKDEAIRVARQICEEDVKLVACDCDSEDGTVCLAHCVLDALVSQTEEARNG